MPRSESKTKALSLGKRLKERRELLEISLEELARKSGVPAKYLRRVEKDEWNSLPAGVYTKGILRRYCQAIGENPDRVAKEFQIILDDIQGKDIGKSKPQTAYWRFSPRFFRLAAVVVVLIALVGYITYQLAPVLARPELAVERPVGAETVVRQDSIVFAGRTERGASLFLNGETLTLDENGRFETTIELLPGLNIFEVKAVSRFNKETIVERKVIFIEE